jgi:transposase
MAERRKRRRFTAEFKTRAVERLLEGGRGLSEVAAELGLSPGQPSQWRNEHLAAGSAEALAARKAEQAELQRLGRENKRLGEEVEILSKAAAFSPGGSREPVPVRLRGRRAGEPRRGEAVPGRRRQHRRLPRPAMVP